MSISAPVAGLSLAMLLASFGTSIANVGLPALAAAFDAAPGDVQWVVLAYLLGTTTLVAGAGRLGDIVGRRRLMLGGITVYVLASGACGVGPAVWLLVLARAVQGEGAAVLMALSTALVAEAVPRQQAGQAMGLLGTMSAIGTAGGPALGGLLIAGFGWRALFAAAVPLGLVALVLVARGLPARAPTGVAERPAFDAAGTLVLALALGAYALAMTVGTGLAVPALLVAAAAGAGLFLAVERRAAAPLVRPAMLRDPVLGAGLAMNAMVATVMMTTLVVGPFYLARGLALDAAAVGLVMAAGPVMSALSGLPAGRLVDRLGARRATMLGLAAMAAGAAGLALLPAGLGIPAYVGPLVVLTPGYALFQAANNTAVMASAPADRRGGVSGLLNLARNLGLISGASVMAMVFAVATGPGPMMADPAAVAAGMQATFAVAAGLVLGALALARSRLF